MFSERLPQAILQDATSCRELGQRHLLPLAANHPPFVAPAEGSEVWGCLQILGVAGGLPTEPGQPLPPMGGRFCRFLPLFRLGTRRATGIAPLGSSVDLVPL